MTIVYFFQNIYGHEYKNITEKTVLYKKHAIDKSVPTPCDKEMWLYYFNSRDNINTQHAQHNKTLGCKW